MNVVYLIIKETPENIAKILNGEYWNEHNRLFPEPQVPQRVQISQHPSFIHSPQQIQLQNSGNNGSVAAYSSSHQASAMSPYANVAQQQNVNVLIESINQMNLLRITAQRMYPNNLTLQTAFVFLKLRSNFGSVANGFYGNSQYFNARIADCNQWEFCYQSFVLWSKVLHFTFLSTPKSCSTSLKEFKYFNS